MQLLVGGSGSSGNSYILKADDRYLILDAGVSLKAMMPLIDFQISKLDGVLISHFHIDHFGYANDWKKRGIKLITPFDDSNKNTTLKKGSSFSFKPFELKDTLGNWVHTNSDGTPCENYGYYIKLPNNEVLVYATDCEIIKWKFPNVNHYLIEANYDLDTLENDGELKARRVFGSHLSIQAACKFIQANQSSDLKTVTLCHLSSQNGSPEKFKKMMEETVGSNVKVEIARKGLVIDL